MIGTNGVQRFEVNAYGKRINQIDFQAGQQGKTIKLTIDTDIQYLVREELIKFEEIFHKISEKFQLYFRHDLRVHEFCTYPR